MIVTCKHCNCEIKTPPSKAWRTNYCSKTCRDNAKSLILQSRTRLCNECNSKFTPRKYQIDTGNGKYCSVNCRNAAVIKDLLTKESKQKSKETYMKRLLAGEIVHKSGADSPRWKGGQAETIKRRIADGRANESVKKYREKNPHKQREWSSIRSSRKIGRLPRGTVLRQGEFQEWKCAYCKLDIKTKYHVDHIVPLSKGGLHAPENLQLTCPSCNLKKSNKTDFTLA